MSEQSAESTEQTQEADELLDWLGERIEASRDSYQRDTNDRHTAISLGKVRAYKNVQKKLIERLADAGGEGDE